jgi:hypothetical protein
MSRVIQNNVALFNAKAATGVSPALNVADFREIVVAITAPANTTATVKFQGSIGKSVSDAGCPDFSAAQAVTNHWDYISHYPLQTGALVIGDTGVVIDNYTAAVNTQLFIVNVSAIRWLSAEVASYTDGSITAWVMAADAQ